MVNFSTLFISLLAVAGSGVSAIRSANPALSQVNPISGSLGSRDHMQFERMTNAKRMAQGLPPLPPRRRNHNDLLGRGSPQPSGTPGNTVSGAIQVTDANTGEFLGYVSKNYELFGEYGLVNRLRSALKVKITGVTNGKTGPHQLTHKNGDSNFPNVGAVAGYYNSGPNALKAGSFNYVYIGGVGQTAPGATPAVGPSAFYQATGIHQPIESAIWYFNTHNRKITLGWVNPDGTLTDAKLILYKPDGTLFATGDVPAFRNEFGQTVRVVFTLVDD